MKKIMLLVLITLFVFTVFAQTKKGYIYLKSGTILNGKYKYSDNLEKVKVESAGKVWIFDASEVDSVSSIKSYKKENFKKDNFSKSSVFVRTDIGVLIGNSENSQSAPFSFTSSVNYFIDRNFSIGAGVGVEFLKETYLPVFANFEYKFKDSNSTPFLFLKTGYQVPLEESREIYYNGYQPWSSSIWPGPDYLQEPMDTKGGVLINPGVGYQSMFSSGFGMSFAFGYQFHRLHYTGENDYGLDIDYNRLTIKLGIIF
ncbi:MAG: hypothetical protein GQ525_09795 [Draconibacterium sp.]|nr:hypothetical protein [Draconibacterium sp.]